MRTSRQVAHGLAVSRRGLALAGLLALGLAAGCATLPGSGWIAVSVRKGAPFAIARSTNVAWGVATHPTIVQLTSNRLVCRFNVIGDLSSGRLGTAGLDGPCYSDDAGKTWTAGDPVDWVTVPTNFPTHYKAGEESWVHYGHQWSVAHWPDGRRIALHRDFVRDIRDRPETLGSFTNTLIWCEDGRTWQGPESVWARGFPPGNGPGQTEFDRQFILPPRGLVMPDGRLLAACYNFPNFSATQHWVHSTFLLQSTNQGRSFEYVSLIANKEHVIRSDQWGLDGPCEPALARLPDGELLCYMRTGEAYYNRFATKGYCLDMLEARSRDEGRTWSVRQVPDLRGVMPCLVQMSNGVLALAYGRPGGRVQFSLDGGRTWPASLAVVPYDRSTSGYIDMIEVSPGRLLIVYDRIKEASSNVWLWEPPAPANVIYGVFVDVQPRTSKQAGG